jgi:hypothetical protein
MENVEEKKDILWMLKWAPIEIGISLLLIVISMSRTPFSALFVSIAAGVGVFYGIILIFGFLKDAFGLAFAGGGILTIIAEGLAKSFVFDILDQRAQAWWVSAQFISIVLGVSLSLAWGVRRRLARSLSKPNAEQIVGPERRERVL